MLKYLKKTHPQVATALLFSSQTSTMSFSTICIMAGSPTHDLHGARLMRNLQKHSKEPIKFVGMGGPQMKAEGLAESFGDITQFLDKPFMPYKNFLRFHIERPYHPVLAYYHYHNRNVLKLLESQNFYNKLVTEINPQAIITLGNEFFMRRSYQKIVSACQDYGVVRPPTFFVDKVHINQRHEFKLYLDHFFNTLPREQINWGYFTFPHTTVGHEGIGRAWQFLISRSKHFKSLAGPDHIYLNEKYNRDMISTLVEEERSRFRSESKIADTATVFFLAPGNTEAEVKWSLSILNKGIEKFFQRDEIKNLDKQNFVAVVSIPEHGATTNAIESLINQTKFGCRVVTVKTDNDKWSAMAGSDIGLAVNGEIVSECAAAQLPTVVLDNTPFLQAYFTQLYNSFNVDINIAINGEAYQELLNGANNPTKISEELYTHFADPQLRYYYVDRYQKALFNMVPQVNDVTGADSKAITFQNRQFTKHVFTQDQITNTVFKAIQAYENTQQQHIPKFKIEEAREELLKNLGWD